MGISVVGMNHIKLTIAKQLTHLRDLSKSSFGCQLVNDATCRPNLVCKTTDFSDGEKFRLAVLSVMMARQVGQNSF